MKKIIYVMMGLVLLGVVLAVSLGNIDKQIDIPKDDYDLLNSVGATECTATPLNCNEDECDAVRISCNYGETTVKLYPYYIDDDNIRHQYTNQELQQQLEDNINSLKDRILTRLRIIQQQEEKEEKIGEVTIEYV